MDPENYEVRAPQRREGRKQDSGMCARARQFSDPQHLVAQELGRVADENADQPKPDGCVNRGFFWDMAILYTPHSKGRQTPTAVFSNGPVVRVASALEKALQNRPITVRAQDLV